MKRGFTLIELSIVLVIIGLIVGGIVAGKELITSAAVRSQITQIEQLETQMHAFRLKYNCMPGDCANATSFFGTIDSDGNSVTNGDGDNIILSQANAYQPGQCLGANAGKEVTQLFLHLNLAKLSNYTATGMAGMVGPTVNVEIGIDLPVAAIYKSSGMVVTCMSGENLPQFETGNNIALGFSNDYTTRARYRLGSTAGRPGAGIPPASAYSLDRKMDDGVGNAGRIGVVYQCNNTTGLANYFSIASDCLVTIAKNIK